MRLDHLVCTRVDDRRFLDGAKRMQQLVAEQGGDDRLKRKVSGAEVLRSKYG